MKDLARRGAQARLVELVAEMDSILGAFPDLGKAPARPTEARKAAATPKKKRVMSAQARARISAAQKKRWRNRRAGKKR